MEKQCMDEELQLDVEDDILLSEPESCASSESPKSNKRHGKRAQATSLAAAMERVLQRALTGVRWRIKYEGLWSNRRGSCWAKCPNLATSL